jgi:hypothetical protein
MNLKKNMKEMDWIAYLEAIYILSVTKIDNVIENYNALDYALQNGSKIMH